MERAYYDNKPLKFEAIGNGSYFYRWDIREETVLRDFMKPEQLAEHFRRQYSCYEVIVWATVTSDKITEAVISALWPQSYEQKLINEYNSAKLGIYGNEEANEKIATYKQFLEDRAALKSQMDADFEELNIR